MKTLASYLTGFLRQFLPLVAGEPFLQLIKYLVLARRGPSMARSLATVAPKPLKEVSKTEARREAASKGNAAPPSKPPPISDRPPKSPNSQRGGLSLAQAALAAGRAAANKGSAKPDALAKAGGRRLDQREQPGNAPMTSASDSEGETAQETRKDAENSSHIPRKRTFKPPLRPKGGGRAAAPLKRSRLNQVKP